MPNRTVEIPDDKLENHEIKHFIELGYLEVGEASTETAKIEAAGEESSAASISSSEVENLETKELIIDESVKAVEEELSKSKRRKK